MKTTKILSTALLTLFFATACSSMRDFRDRHFSSDRSARGESIEYQQGRFPSEANSPEQSVSSDKSLSSFDSVGAGAMDKDEMKTMMKQCMNQHKDRKMCEEGLLTKCEEGHDKAECQKMAKEAKLEVKTKQK